MLRSLKIYARGSMLLIAVSWPFVLLPLIITALSVGHHNFGGFWPVLMAMATCVILFLIGIGIMIATDIYYSERSLE